jgi:hypothetical protein
MFRTVCSISNIAPRFEAQDPLAPPNNEPNEPKAENKKYPRFRSHPCRERFGSRDNIINTFAKAVAARRQRLFVLPGEDKRFFGRRWNDNIVSLNRRKTAIIGVLGGERGRTQHQAGGSKNAEAHSQGPHHPPHIRLWHGPVNDADALR